VERHPHIYGDVEANDEETVKANWEKIKLKKGKTSVLEGVPRSLPSLVKAYRVQDKVRGVGFDWDHVDQVWDKVQEELGELQAELSAEEVKPDRVADEFGDVMFALINYSRFVDVNPDEALERTTRRFMARFQHLEKAIAAEKKDLANMNLSEMDVYWERAKAALG
jgi:XTP/dITP diphosphohydrolase